MAARLYGPFLRTSVSRMEQFAACPFKFFVHSGLRAEERKLFELDIKEQGTFQHDVLALFHEQLRAEQKRWRDITPAEARERVAGIARGLVASYRDGLLEASEQTRFMARILTESLQDFVETLTGWMREQYQFDPVAVELPFGEDEGSPAWIIDLGQGHRLELYGRIDRVDLWRDEQAKEALCVVVDYKSSQKQLDPVLLAHGLQLQLLTYLNVLRHWPNPREMFGVARLAPAGVFYVNLRGKYDHELNRLDALADIEQARKLAYRHVGRFDTRALRQLDGRPGARQGDQFNYRLTNDGQVYKSSREALATGEFEALLDSVETHLEEMGRRIYLGAAEVAPFRKSSTTACDQCSYQSICRIDPWTHRYRVLRKEKAEG
jgi:ATP-dependent helicase/nuclease subunit B